VASWLLFAAALVAAVRLQEGQQPVAAARL
jgi:hypothetical protein